jgi:NAD(P)H-flavin reductase
MATFPNTNDSDPMLPVPFRIVSRRRETSDTFTLELVPVERAAPFYFSPGQFNMLYAFGVGESAISISGSTSNPERLVHTIRAVGTVTRALQKLRKGDVLGVRGPFGSAWPVVEAEGRDILFITGGIGLAPLRPALYHILENRDRYGRVIMLYGARTGADILYRKELETWGGRLDMDVFATVDQADRTWFGSVGIVTQLIARARFDRLQTTALVCGPEIMMRFSILELKKQGLSESNIHVSMERNMKCAVGFCGHCQYGPMFICKDGPVFPFERIRTWFETREI